MPPTFQAIPIFRIFDGVLYGPLYFFKLFICGGPELAPALPQSANIRFGNRVRFNEPVDAAPR